MLSRLPLLVTALLGIVSIAGCTTVSAGDPQPVTTGHATGSSTSADDGDEEELPFAGAPEVTDPLDTDRFEQDPCQSLTAEQAKYLGLPESGTTMENVALGNGCEWANDTTRGRVIIVFIVDDPRGLSPEYEAEKDGAWKYFDVLPEIDGYPAVARSGIDDRDIGHCTVVTGVADDMAFESIVELSQVNVADKDPCLAASEVAGLALKTMREQ